jgi:hypothetical protein
MDDKNLHLKTLMTLSVTCSLIILFSLLMAELKDSVENSGHSLNNISKDCQYNCESKDK